LNEIMDTKVALAKVAASLREGAELRMQISRDNAEAIVEAASAITKCLRGGGKLLLFGNGGSAADAQHLAAEFVGRFIGERRALPAIALTTDSSIITAVGNDYGFEHIFARQIEGLGRANDVAIGVSTSGNSPNVIAAVEAASKRGLKTIGLIGKDGGMLAKCVDIAITVSAINTARIQECHIAIGHLFCELVELNLVEENLAKGFNSKSSPAE